MSVLYNLSCKTLAQESERSKFSIAHFVVELARNSVASNRPPPMVAHSSPIATTAVDAKGLGSCKKFNKSGPKGCIMIVPHDDDYTMSNWGGEPSNHRYYPAGPVAG